MSETLGMLDRTIAARGPDSIWVQSRDEIAHCHQTIADLNDTIRSLRQELAEGGAA